MKKISTIISIISLTLWPKLFCQAANLSDAFSGFLEKAGGRDGAGYDPGQRTIDPIIGNIILIITSVLGVLFLALMIYGGFTWMTALGDEKKVTKAKDLLVAAIIGLIILVAAYMVTYFVFIKIAQPSLTV